MPAPLIIAHRGASHAEPENTAAAFDAALDEGADGIELDLQLSRDGVVAVYHDHGLDRLGAARTHISQHDWATLAAMDAGRWFAGRATGHRMLRLEQVLERWGWRTTLYLEIKNYEGHAGRERHRLLARRVAVAVREAGLEQRVAILSFHDHALDDIHAVAPELPLVRNVLWRRGLASAQRRAARLAALCLAIDRFGPAEAAEVQEVGLPVYAYTCDGPVQFQRARALGAAGVISNRPADARRWHAGYA